MYFNNVLNIINNYVIINDYLDIIINDYLELNIKY